MNALQTEILRALSCFSMWNWLIYVIIKYEMRMRTGDFTHGNLRCQQYIKETIFITFFHGCDWGTERRSLYLPDREASLIKKEYCRCGPHPPQVTSPRARPPLVKGAGCIGPPPRFVASIAPRGPSTPAPEAAPGASLHSEALSPERWRECPGTGDCEPTRHVGAGLRGLLLADCLRVARATTPGPRLSHMAG